MLHVVVGIVAMILGLWGIARNWFVFIDLFWAILPLVLIAAGVISLLAGIREKTSKKKIGD